MLHIFNSVLGMVRLDDVNIENTVFRLHYKITTIILIVFSLLVSSGQFFGDPIDCIFDIKNNAIPSKVLDTYCWIHSTYTVHSDQNALNASVSGNFYNEEDPYPGVQPLGKNDKVTHHKYYQWVGFVLIIQALLFYVPRFTWRCWEGGKMEMLVLDLNNPVIGEVKKKENINLLVDYFTSNLHRHDLYAIMFFICEVLNFVNVIGQMFAIDVFLGGEFSTYGIDVFRLPAVASMSKVFPKMAKCTFRKFGPSGTPEIIDGLCLLPLNIMNEKIYIFIWFWFIILAIITGLFLIYRCFVTFSPPNCKFRKYLFRAQAQLANHKEMEIVVQKCQIGDWFLLVQLCQNIDPIAFKELISEMASRFKSKPLISA